ncbi:hypothetical protein OBBRIDRAFT_797327 [Obba rivulosa]|uniref:Uncharacterized protein n=1 Tax=Obba rivulosa TaxID=1052685 RepID=A0A8E2DHX4_9APHY|nr:hypothetical protein OBBRIDRAFT_797327 [Obba rivulosa]
MFPTFATSSSCLVQDWEAQRDGAHNIIDIDVVCVTFGLGLTRCRDDRWNVGTC